MGYTVESSSPGYYDDGDEVHDNVEFFDLAQHPRAKKAQEKYNTAHKYADLSVEEKAYFDNNRGYTSYFIFFDGVAPMHHYKTYSLLQHNIRAYTLSQLVQRNEICLFSFDNTAALSSLKISEDKETVVPDNGAFVIEKGDLVIILDIQNLGVNKEWNWYVKSSEQFSKFSKFFNDIVPKYNQYKNKVFNSSGNFINLPNATFEDIFLSEDIRKEVRTNIIDYVDSSKLEIKKKNGLPTKRGIIMAGAPGTGKTFLSRVLAKTLKTTFMVVTKLSYSSEVDGIFEFAKLFDRIIILFEDIDIYAGNRDDGEIVSAMFNNLDGFEINNHLIVLCTTNRLDVLDDALKDRPGRFDRILEFKAPGVQLKAEMLKGFCEGKIVDAVDFVDVVKNLSTEYTGAYLKELYITAVTEAIEQQSVNNDGIAILTTKIFKVALEKLRKQRKEVTQIGFNREESKGTE